MTHIEPGRTIMLQIVAEVREKAPPWDALAAFAKEHDGLDRETPCCDGPGGFCVMYHQAPDPNAAAFTSWLEDGKIYGDLATCGWYRATFRWQVARSVEVAVDLEAKHGMPFPLDECGAVVAPDTFRPEDALAIGALHKGKRIVQAYTSRTPRDYMDDPPWYPMTERAFKKAAEAGRSFTRLHLGGPIHIWLEYAPPAETIAPQSNLPADGLFGWTP